MVLELLGRLFSADGGKWRLQPGLAGPDCLSARRQMVAFPGNFGRKGSTSLQCCSGDPGPLFSLSRIWILISPNLLSEDRG